MMKRIFDLTVSAVGLVGLTPLLLLLAAAVKASDPRSPVFYRAQRVGKGGVPFELLKFRSMIVGADRLNSGITIGDDPRITPIGRFLRRTKLDELPQLINVVRGDMSLVGPRPEDPRYVAMYTSEQLRVLDVKPGITSAASLAYRDEERLLAEQGGNRAYIERVMPDKLAIEIDYLRRQSLWSDLTIIIKTIFNVPG